jgi:hypothetical protein
MYCSGCIKNCVAMASRFQLRCDRIWHFCIRTYWYVYMWDEENTSKAHACSSESQTTYQNFHLVSILVIYCNLNLCCKIFLTSHPQILSKRSAVLSRYYTVHHEVSRYYSVHHEVSRYYSVHHEVSTSWSPPPFWLFFFFFLVLSLLLLGKLLLNYLLTYSIHGAESFLRS